MAYLSSRSTALRGLISIEKHLQKPCCPSLHQFRLSSTGAMLKSYLVTPKDVSNAMSNSQQDPSSSRIIPVCAAWFLPNDPQKRTGKQAYIEKRIPSALFFDIDGIRDDRSPYPHMLPTAEGFATAMSDLGIRREDRLVVYDTAELGIFSAPRVAWTFRVFGHSNVHILNNFRIWVEQGFPIESGEPTGALEKSTYPLPAFNTDRVACFRDVRLVARELGKEGEEKVQILDARSGGRFSGKEPEPRPDLSSGHMPGSLNVPLPNILDPRTKAFLPKEELRKVFEDKGVDAKSPVITTCGTGVMAAALEAALAEAHFGKESDRRVYDGSWTEYAQRASSEEGLIVKDP